MKPLRPRYTKIQALVEHLLERNKVRVPPVPILPIALNCGALVQHNLFDDDISGVLVRDAGGTAIIGVQSAHHPARQRFTIAHELGHLLLHQGDPVHVDKQFRLNFRSAVSATAQDIEEIEANAFAAEILMPDKFLKRDAFRLSFDIEDETQVRALAKRYAVSAQAMSIRLVNLIAARRILL